MGHVQNFNLCLFIILIDLSLFLFLDSWSELCSSIRRYAGQIPVSPRSQPLLMSRLENLLERVRLNRHCTQIPGSKLIASNWVNVDEDVCPVFSLIPWVDVLVICIDHKLKDWVVCGQPVCEGESIVEAGNFTRTPKSPFSIGTC